MRRLFVCVLALAAALSLAPVGVAQEEEPQLPEPVPCNGCWVPDMQAEWQIQFTGELNTSLDVDMYEVDMFDTSAATVQEIQQGGTGVVCYISAGSWENWRPDKDDFPKSVKGKTLDGWPGERWLDIRDLETLQPIMQARIDRCASKGFDSVEFDNVNGYQNDTGFPLKGADQLQYNAWLANASHEAGLSVALKNDGPQAAKLVDYFDWALVEQCFQYRECGAYDVFVDAGKAVMEIEYKLERRQFCNKATARNFNAMRKKLSLNAWRRPCPSPS